MKEIINKIITKKQLFTLKLIKNKNKLIDTQNSIGDTNGGDGK